MPPKPSCQQRDSSLRLTVFLHSVLTKFLYWLYLQVKMEIQVVESEILFLEDFNEMHALT